MSENNEVEDKRAKQLEEARKRVQELKKKKKNKNKKNKNKNGIDTEVDADEKKVGEEIQNKDDSTTNTANNNSDSNACINEEENTREEEKEEGEATAAKEVGTKEISNDSKVNVVENTSKERDSDEESKLELDNKTFKQDEESNTVDELFSNGSDNKNGSDDFLTTIEKEKQVNEIFELKEQIQKLLEENKKLKFINMEQETSIDELQEEISELKIKLKESEDQINVISVKLKETESKLGNTESSREPFNDNNYDHTNTSNTVLKFASFQSSSGTNTPVQSTYSNSTITPWNVSKHISNKSPQVVVDRVLLDKWKNWNVNMTTWRSIGSGPVVEL